MVTCFSPSSVFICIVLEEAKEDHSQVVNLFKFGLQWYLWVPLNSGYSMILQVFLLLFLLVSGIPFVLGLFSSRNLGASADTTIPSRKPSGRWTAHIWTSETNEIGLCELIAAVGFFKFFMIFMKIQIWSLMVVSFELLRVEEFLTLQGSWIPGGWILTDFTVIRFPSAGLLDLAQQFPSIDTTGNSWQFM